MSSSVADEAFRECEEDCARVQAPFDPAIVEDCDHLATQRAPQRRHAVAGCEVCGLPKRVNDGGHVFLGKDARDVVRECGDHFASANGWQVSKNRRRHLSGDIGKGVSIKKQKRCRMMTTLEEIQQFEEAQLAFAPSLPFFTARAFSF